MLHGYLLIQSGADGVVFDAEGRIIKESAIWADRVIETIGLKELRSRARPLDHAVFVGIDPGWWTFYHWFVISLSRIGFYFNFCDTGAKVVVAPYRDDGRMRFGRDVWADTLAIAAPHGQSVTLPDGIYYAPSIGLSWIDYPQQAFVSYFCAFRSIMESMRKKIGVVGTVPRKRIILLRDSDQRLCEPAQEALQNLVDHDGFVIARPERISIRDQAQLFAECSSIVAPHGAGLCNILFGDPTLRVLELNTEYDGPYVRPWFYLLAAVRQQPYAYLNQTRSRFSSAEIRDMTLRFVER